MINYILSVMSVLLFCGCCFLLIKSATTPIPIFIKGRYSKSAQRVAKNYKTCAWAILAVFFLASLVVSFNQVFVTL